MLDGERRKKAFPAMFIDPNGAEIFTPRGQAEFIAYADAKNDPKTTRYMREQERCSADNRAAVAALDGQKIGHRDFAQDACDRDRLVRGDDMGKGKDSAYGQRGGRPEDRRGSGGGGRGGQSSRGQSAGGQSPRGQSSRGQSSGGRSPGGQSSGRYSRDFSSFQAMRR